MSESRFVNQHIQSFASAHPYESGWKLYEYPSGMAYRISLVYLLDFLQDRHPDAIKRRTTIKELSGKELDQFAGETCCPELDVEWDRSRELESESWHGLIEIDWAGQPLHFFSILLQSGHGYATIYQVATQSNVALRTFTHALDDYGRMRKTRDARQILAVNGDNIPLTPVSWEDIFLPPGFIEAIRSNVTAFFEGQERYQALGIPHRRGLLFTGSPGCGKTLTLKALAYHTAAKFVTVLGKANVSDEDIENAFDVACRCSPAVVLLEDLDKLLESKDVSLAHFLNLLDGLNVVSGVLVIATCNEPEKLDPALLHRPSRFDRVWTFPLPPLQQRLALLRKHGGLYFSDDALTQVAGQTQGMSMAYVQEIVVNALLECAHEGKTPGDQDLLRSLTAIRTQRKNASKGVESLEEQDSVGFCLSN